MAIELNYYDIQEWTWAFNTLPHICKVMGCQVPKLVLRMVYDLLSRRIARALWKGMRREYVDDADNKISRALWRVAVELEDLDCIQLLLDYQQYAMNRLEPALAKACLKGNLEIVKLLLNTPYNAPRADSRFASRRDGHALGSATACDHLHVVKYLVAFPQNAPSIEDHGHALTTASFYGRVAIVKFLVEYPHKSPHALMATVNAGNEALFHAVWNGHIDVVKFLLDYLGTPPGETLHLLDVAISRQHQNIVDLLSGILVH